MKNLLYRFQATPQITPPVTETVPTKKEKQDGGTSTHIPAKSEVQLSLFDLFENEGSAIDVAKKYQNKKVTGSTKENHNKEKNIQ
nr:hypothetical protein [Chryseobacterium glaciei]